MSAGGTVYDFCYTRANALTYSHPGVDKIGGISATYQGAVQARILSTPGWP